MRVEEVNKWIRNANMCCEVHSLCNDCPLVGEDERGEYCKWEAGNMTQEQVDMIASYEPPIDWSKVAPDTKVIVWHSEGARKYKRYFAKYMDGKIFTYEYGATSWSHEPDLLVEWKHGRLAEDGE